MISWSQFGVLLHGNRRGGVTSDVVDQVPDCAAGILCWPMRGKIFCW